MTQDVRVPNGFRLNAHDSLDSTSEEAKRLAAAGAGDRTVVWAGEQVTGRGRHGRSWTSPQGNLYVSILFRPGCPVATAPQLGFVVGVAMAEAINRFSAVPVRLKWPDDILLEDRKLSGILLESAGTESGDSEWIVAGIGVNVASYPRDLAGTTCLSAAGTDVSVARLLEAFLEHLSALYDLWAADGFAAIRPLWSGHALEAGSQIAVKLPDRTVSGAFEGIDEAGNLLVDAGGNVLHVAAGEVFPLSTGREE